MVVIYAEKFSLAKNIARALGAGQRIPHKKDGKLGIWKFKFKGEDAILTYGAGHLIDLSPIIAYGDKYRKWDLNIYPLIPPSEPLMEISKGKELCYSSVKQLFNKADWIINATDIDREGELIFYRIYKFMGCKKPWKRAIWRDETASSIKEAFDHLIDGSQRIYVQQSGIARSIADYQIGLNLTVATTQKSKENGEFSKEVFSVGRVQTAVLNLVVAREREITGFNKKSYWQLLLDCYKNNTNFVASHINNNFESQSEAINTKSNCKNIAIVTDVDVTINKKYAPKLFNSTQLKIACNRKYGWTIGHTDKVMQQLYENRKMTYPRTSTEYLPSSMIPEVTATIKKLMEIPVYSKYKIDESKWLPFTKKHFDDDKIGSHTAIIPTNEVCELNKLSLDEQKLYDIIARSLISLVVPPMIEEHTAVTLDCNGEIFRAKGKKTLRKGWGIVLGSITDDKIIPLLDKGEVLDVSSRIAEIETKPKERYSEATLIKAMETAGRTINDENTRALMLKNNMGLGTEATRTAIINKLYEHHYLLKKGNVIHPTSKGKYLIDNLPINDLKSAEMTGQWEKTLNDIALGEYSYNQYRKDMDRKTLRWYQQICNAPMKPYIVSSDVENKELICPCCGNKILLNKEKSRYNCSGYKQGCRYGFNLEICGKRLNQNNIIKLVSTGKTNLIKGFINNKGKIFDAYFCYNEKEQKFEFQIPKKN